MAQHLGEPIWQLVGRWATHLAAPRKADENWQTMMILQENQAALAQGISQCLRNNVNAYFAAAQGASQIADSMTTALFSWQPLINKHWTLTHSLRARVAQPAQPISQKEKNHTDVLDSSAKQNPKSLIPSLKTCHRFPWQSRQQGDSSLSSARCPLIRRLRGSFATGDAAPWISPSTVNSQRFRWQYKSLRQILLRDAAVVAHLLCQNTFHLFPSSVWEST